MEALTTVNETVYRELRSQIVSGELQPGARLVHRQLAKQFGTSNIPVVESIRRLERDGLVVNEPKWGARVRAWTADDLEIVYFVREMLEGKTCRLFAERAARSDWLALVEHNERIEAYARDLDVSATIDEDLELHLHILRCAGSDFLYHMAENSCVIAASMPNRFLPSRKPEAYLGNIGIHDELIAALGGGDPDAAQKAGKEHIRKGFEALLAAMKQAEVTDNGLEAGQEGVVKRILD